MSKVYVLCLDTGSYDSYSSCPIRVYTSEDRVQAQEKNINDMLAIYTPQIDDLRNALGNEASAAHQNQPHTEVRQLLDEIIARYQPKIDAVVEEFISKIGEEFRQDFEGLKYGSDEERVGYAICDLEY